MTFAICKAINVFVKLRLPDEDLEIGDVAVHGDVAYELVPQAPRDRVEGPPIPPAPDCRACLAVMPVEVVVAGPRGPSTDPARLGLTPPEP
jgi:hypothetical protein